MSFLAPIIEELGGVALPLVGRVLGTAVRTVLGDALYNELFGSAQPDVSRLANAIDTIAQTVTYLSDVIDDVQAIDGQAWLDMLQWYQNAGGDIAAIGGNMYYAFRWTYELVIPSSLQWLYTNMYNFLIHPLQNRVGVIEWWDRQFREHLTRIDHWGETFVNPTLHQWLTWYAWWKTYPRSMVELLHSWVQHPMRFGQWATPPIAHGMIPWLGDRAQRRLLDTLTSEVLAATPDVIETVILTGGQLLNTSIPERLAV